MRFLYGGRMPSPYCFGMEQLPSKGDMLFITGGEKDVLPLSARHFHAICFNSKTTLIPERIIESLQLRFRHIILLYDSDATGLREPQWQVGRLSAFKCSNFSSPSKGRRLRRIFRITLLWGMRRPTSEGY